MYALRASLQHTPGFNHLHSKLRTQRCLPAPPPQDLSTRRNAFHMLAEHAQDKAVAYLFQQIDRVADWGDILQIAVLDLIRKVRLAAPMGSAAATESITIDFAVRPQGTCQSRLRDEGLQGCPYTLARIDSARGSLRRSAARVPAGYAMPPLGCACTSRFVLPVPAAPLQVCRSNPEQKGKYIKIILALLQSRSTAVMYECAVTLVSLSSAPTAVRAAANCFCQLLVSHSDNNVKLIVLDRLQVYGCLGWGEGRDCGFWVRL